ncbi:DMT family transporter [Shewanella youngdeokensis]|uniref:EamA family transporter n=1 Tax=Shewanella youngdeokensis TaxID=2999068 RepID=A0ABZ0JXF8_9GAMM|nr:EamA family transporter [Shewanella sp. DAU334]
MKTYAWRGQLILLLTTLLAAIGWIASKYVIEVVPGDGFIAARFTLASLILLPFCYRQISNLSLKNMAAICMVGGILALSMQVFIFALSISNNLGEGAFIMSLAMIIAPLTSWLLFQTRPNRAFWIALPIAVMGIALLTLTHEWTIETSQWYFLLASTLLSAHFVCNKKVVTASTPLASICLQLMMVGLGGIIAILWSPPESFELNSHIIFWFFISTIVATAIRYLLQTTGQLLVKTETAAIIMILEPVWTLTLSIFLLGEAFEIQKLIGAAVIIISLLVYIKLQQKPN